LSGSSSGEQPRLAGGGGAGVSEAKQQRREGFRHGRCWFAEPDQDLVLAPDDVVDFQGLDAWDGLGVEQ